MVLDKITNTLRVPDFVSSKHVAQTENNGMRTPQS